MYRVELPTERRVKNYLKAKSTEQLRDDLYQAQMFIYDAWDTNDEDKRSALVKKALRKSPLCSDAYLLYVNYFNEQSIATVAILQFAVLMAEKGLIEPLSSFEGYFWGDVDTRPYMRAKAELAKSLWDIGHYNAAIKEYENLLALNPNDNQGVRYLLAAYYLELEAIDKLKTLFKTYKEDGSPFLLYNQALVAYKEKSRNAKKLALEAIRSNSYVISYLNDGIKPEKSESGFYTIGGEDEAKEYVFLNILNWLRADNAIAWLSEISKENVHSLKK